LRKKIERDPLIELLKKRREKFLLVRSYLQNKKNSCIIFVLDAERLSILETADAISLLKKHGIEVDGIIINRILTKINSKFFSKRKEIQKKNLDEIKTKFKEMIIGYIPLLESDIYGKESLEKIKFDKFK
ncbi:arsenic-transporting ATPase, partial [Candidatus Aminicenantes bacterium AC-708-I09]|nr:arsenic-transporting ATPase [Candidatus Aminicenantes bacterium AC-708-I09]